jgi:SAM-dependent methyltransferase
MKIETITICCSASFYKQALEMEDKLQKLGFQVKVPLGAARLKEGKGFNPEAHKSEYIEKKKFDIAIAVMVFEHIIDLHSAFAKIAKLLHSKGSFYLIAGDKEYHTTPRFGYELDVEELESDVVVARVRRSYGLLYDILRPISHFIEAGEQTGFMLNKHIELKPTQSFLKLESRYSKFKDTALAHLFVFKLQ